MSRYKFTKLYHLNKFFRLRNRFYGSFFIKVFLHYLFFLFFFKKNKSNLFQHKVFKRTLRSLLKELYFFAFFGVVKKHYTFLKKFSFFNLKNFIAEEFSLKKVALNKKIFLLKKKPLKIFFRKLSMTFLDLLWRNTFFTFFVNFFNFSFPLAKRF
jgi:hypothetical protein